MRIDAHQYALKGIETERFGRGGASHLMPPLIFKANINQRAVSAVLSHEEYHIGYSNYQ